VDHVAAMLAQEGATKYVRFKADLICQNFQSRGKISAAGKSLERLLQFHGLTNTGKLSKKVMFKVIA